MANQGIMHIATKRGGIPICRNRTSLMSTTVEHLDGWNRVCKKCLAVQARQEAIRAKRTAQEPKIS